MSPTDGVAYDPSVADYRATSPRWRAGRNLSCSLILRPTLKHRWHVYC